MTSDQVKEYYGTGYRFAKQTDMCANSFDNWMRWGRVPTFSQLKIDRFTKGKLKANQREPEGKQDLVEKTRKNENLPENPSLFLF